MVHHPGENLDNKIDLLHEVYGDFTMLQIIEYEAGSRGAQPAKATNLLRELIKSPLASYRELAKTLSVSEATVQRYFRELAASGAFVYEPVIDAGDLEQFIFHVGIPVEPPTRAQVIRKFKEEFPDTWLGFDHATNLVGIVCSADGFRAVDSLMERLTRTQEFPGYGIAIDLVTVDNQLNLRVLREQ